MNINDKHWRGTCPVTKRKFKIIKKYVDNIGYLSGRRGTYYICSECGKVLSFIGKIS